MIKTEIGFKKQFPYVSKTEGTMSMLEKIRYLLVCEVSCWSTLVCICFHIHTFTQIHIQWAHQAFNSIFHMGGFLKISASPCLRTAVFMASADRRTRFLPGDGKENDQQYKGIVSHMCSPVEWAVQGNTPKPSCPEHLSEHHGWHLESGKYQEETGCRAGLLILLGETQLSLHCRAWVIFIFSPHLYSSAVALVTTLKTIHIYHFSTSCPLSLLKKKNRATKQRLGEEF